MRGATSALGLALVMGCGAIKLPSILDFGKTRVGWTQVTLATAADANRRSAMKVDLVLVTDQAVFDEIIQLPASRWFATRTDWVRTHPQGITYRSWEPVPGQQLTVDGDIFGRPRVAGAVVFADYGTTGSHRARIDTFSGPLIVRLEAEDLHVSSASAR